MFSTIIRDLISFSATDEFSKKERFLSYEPHGSIISTPARSAGEILTHTGPLSKKVTREDSSHVESRDRGTLWKFDVTSREHIVRTSLKSLSHGP